MTEDDAGADPNRPEDLPAGESASPATPSTGTASHDPAQPTFGAQPYQPYWQPRVPQPPTAAQWPASDWAQPPGSWGAQTVYPAAGWGRGSGYRPGFGPELAPGYMPLRYAPLGPGPGLLWGGIAVRFGALVVDTVLLGCSLFGLGLVLSAIGGGSATRSESTGATAVAVTWWVLVFIYHPTCWYIFGATPGQKALGLRVAQASSGQSLGIGAVIVRYLVFFMVTVAFPLGIVSAAIASKDPFKRAWHDELARSVVVRK